MALSVDVYKSGILLGSGSMNAAAASITTFTANLSRTVNTGRNVDVQVKSGGTSSGTFRTRVTNDGGSTLTVADACPFV